MTRTISRRRLDDLTPHPELLALFGEPPEAEIERLTHSLEAGHHSDVVFEVTPDGRVIVGHAAVLAARRAGLAEIEAVVRKDLAGRGDATVALAIIDAHLDRGRLDKLDTTRCLARAWELAPRLPAEELRPFQVGDLVKQVASRLGMSERGADRYLRLLHTPPEVQAAFKSRKLKLTLAERVAGLPKARQAELAAALRAGEEPRQAVGRFLKLPTGKHEKPFGAWKAFIKALRQGLLDLDGRADKLRAINPEDADIVDRAIALLREVRAAAAVVSPQQQAANLVAVVERGRLGTQVSPEGVGSGDGG